MAPLRLSLRLTAFTLFLGATAVLAAMLLATDTLTRRSIDRTPWARRCFRWACRCLGLHIQVHGTPSPDPVLFVSNHISWTDIPVLGSQAPILFLSKAEVGNWPLIGWLAQQAGTLFIKRGGGRARRVRQTIAERLADDESVLVFPEGTTSQGLQVLPFHGLLLAAAEQSGRPIQAITISYRRDGRPDPIAPFVGDDAFHRHLFTLLRQPRARIDVLFHPPEPGAPALGTGELAARLQARVQAGLTRIQAGELDAPPAETIRTVAGPGLSRPR